eukprot:368217-Rhodomonas_salina.3
MASSSSMKSSRINARSSSRLPAPRFSSDRACLSRTPAGGPRRHAYVTGAQSHNNTTQRERMLVGRSSTSGAR